ncbi:MULTISPECIES: hypothetical protein [Streptomyces]|uniref:Uncharacterized protein n=2 Tax=Streptomyces TaxID=1883 RepID=A0A0W7X9H7_9ACTN|nr:MULTISPECIES: hypothetical protein [Streptomyces]KUF19383.1 hypothetical protein AT728_30745 [Streptomyces silvensis]MVO89190.1 hypothetical protein [Streptomyces typhae]
MFPPTVAVGLHGTLQLRPWFDGVMPQDGDTDVAEDVLSLVVDRAGSYGWRTVGGLLHENGEVTASHEPTAWAHEEVGGDWTQDGQVRQLAWLGAGVLTDPPRPGLPLRPIALLLSEALARAGEVTFTGLHALLPLHATERDTAFHQIELAPWFGLADPDARYEVVVTVSCRTPGDGGGGEHDVTALREAVREKAQGMVDVFAAGTKDTPSGAESALPGLDLDLRRTVHTDGMREVVRFGCGTREWSPDVAVWLVEMTAEALREAGRPAPVVVTASLVTPPA